MSHSRMFIFLSDNGPAFPNAKTNVYDAGSHLPMIVRAPSLAKPAPSTTP